MSEETYNGHPFTDERIERHLDRVRKRMQEARDLGLLDLWSIGECDFDVRAVQTYGPKYEPQIVEVRRDGKRYTVWDGERHPYDYSVPRSGAIHGLYHLSQYDRLMEEWRSRMAEGGSEG